MKKVYLLAALLFTLTALTANAQNTYVPDDNFEQALIDLGYDTALDDSVVTASIDTITVLNVSGKSIANLTGIEGFTALEKLDCSYNKLSSLVLNSNTVLTDLYCYRNQISDLNLSNNPSLVYLVCAYNKLTSLEIGSNAILEALFCSSNRLTELNLKNKTVLEEMDAFGNPNLYCIEVDDPSVATAKRYWKKNGIATYTKDCSSFVVPDFEMTYIPDDNFEQALIDLGYDSGELDDSIPTLTAQSTTALYLDDYGISDLTGLDDFTALEALYCSYNKLTSIDVSKNTKLYYLHCHDNQLTSLDITNNHYLFCFHCQRNLLTSLDISNNTQLIYYYCSGNKLTDIDVRNHSRLQYFGCESNQLTNLNVSSNINLKYLSCRYNQISSLNLNDNFCLTYLNCYDNKLTELTIKNDNNSNMTGNGWEYGMNAANNPNLNCIEVDDPAAVATYSDWKKSSTATYSADCTISSVVDQMNDSYISTYPNPVTNILTINSPSEIKQVQLISVTGEAVLTKSTYANTIELNMKPFNAGVYFVRINTGKNEFVKTIIKE